MFLRRFFEPTLAQTSYLIGCADAGEAIVIDPNRDVEPYRAAARAEGARITHVAETHIHADFVSGARELAARADATMLLSDEGDAGWKYAFGTAIESTSGASGSTCCTRRATRPSMCRSC
jgi:hydroxyacylglutathione hydrolase